MRIGIYGGSFDPVHYGHLLLAESCREQCQLDRIYFLPAAQSPHKRHVPVTAGKERVEMLRLATGGHESFEVKTWELDRGGVSYTVDTLRAIHAEEPHNAWFFLMGGDSLADFPTWREPAEICRLASLVVVDRPGSPRADLAGLASFVAAATLRELEGLRVDMPQIEISSSDLRQRVSSGKSIRFRTPRAVEAFIQANDLYRPAS